MAEIVARPKGATPPELREQVHQYRAELLRLLAEPWDADQAEELLRVTLTAIEVVVHHQSGAVLQRVADLIDEHGPVIDACFSHLDFESLRYALLDLERNARDAVTSRGDDNELAPAPCPVCNGACRWCATIGIVRCGACFPDAGARRAKYARTR